MTAPAPTRLIIPSNKGPQRDKPRRESMRRVRVTFRRELGENAQTVVAGKCLRKSDADEHGSVPFVAYESDIPRIQALVEDDAEGLRRAREAYARKLHASIHEHLDRGEGDGLKRIGGKVVIPEDPAMWPDAMRRVEQVFGGSVEAEFFESNGRVRGVRPLESVEVDDELLDPPMSEHEESVAAVARMLGNAQGGGNTAEIVASVIAALAEQGVIPAGGAKPKRSRKAKPDADGAGD